MTKGNESNRKGEEEGEEEEEVFIAAGGVNHALVKKKLNLLFLFKVIEEDSEKGLKWKIKNDFFERKIIYMHWIVFFPLHF